MVHSLFDPGIGSHLDDTERNLLQLIAILSG
jgi:hypothetical protein